MVRRRATAGAAGTAGNPYDYAPDDRSKIYKHKRSHTHNAKTGNPREYAPCDSSLSPFLPLSLPLALPLALPLFPPPPSLFLSPSLSHSLSAHTTNHKPDPFSFNLGTEGRSVSVGFVAGGLSEARIFGRKSQIDLKDWCFLFRTHCAVHKPPHTHTIKAHAHILTQFVCKYLLLFVLLFSGRSLGLRAH